jgi:hypothetical protein
VTTEEVEPEIPQGSVETRASGRPPEEADSENPAKQARAILEDSEDRKKMGAEPDADAEV